jgi:hypothetical protein
MDKRFEQFKLLKDNWDGDGGLPIEKRAIEIGASIVSRSKIKPQIYASPGGGVDLEWGTLFLVIYEDEILFPLLDRDNYKFRDASNEMIVEYICEIIHTYVS